VDILTAVGFVLAMVAVLVGAVLKGAGISALLSSAAFMIVVVGTIASIFIQTPLPVFKHAMRNVSWIFKPPAMEAEALIKKIVEWSNIARKQGLLGLEPMIDREQDTFIKRGLQLVSMAVSPRRSAPSSKWKWACASMRTTAPRKSSKAWASTRPRSASSAPCSASWPSCRTSADPSKLGHGIAAAFTATVYGIGLANLFFLPIAGKLKGIVAEQTQVREMIIEGIVSIVLGENPRAIESKLHGFLHDERGQTHSVPHGNGICPHFHGT
jgi:chemotaxis protein MotA